MSQHRVTAALLFPEFEFSTSRSGGPGGQNVNKVESKVTLRWNVVHSILITEEERALLRQKLASHLTTSGILTLSSQESRSQLDNKQLVLAKLDSLLAKAFTKRKTRKATKPSKTAIQKRMNTKRRMSEKKKWRQRPD